MMRLDIYLVNNKYYVSRNKAKMAIEQNLILVNNKVINRPNYDVSATDTVQKKSVIEYVSRGAYKLLAAIHQWNINFDNKVVLDIGASTGGFSDVAIKNGAKFIYAIDVGTDQLHAMLKCNKKILSMENTHFNSLSNDVLRHKIDIVMADLSFISLTKLIDKLSSLLSYHHLCIFLIKPEFELSPQEVRRGKVVGNELLIKAVNKITSYAAGHGYQVHGVIESPIKGNKLDNTEFLVYLEKQNN